MSTPEGPFQNVPDLICEARFLQRLSEVHRRLSLEDEPPRWDRAAHNAWEDRKEEFTVDCEMLREDIETLIKEWEA